MEPSKRIRPSWEEYFMEITKMVAKRSTCLRRQVGAVIVKDKRILATGYNGAPTNTRHCLDIGCLREQMGIPSGQRIEICRGLHAEQNAIIQAGLHGVSIKAAEIYSTHQPCITCAKMIVNSGILRVFFEGDYPDPMALEILKEAGVDLVRVNSVVSGADPKPG